MNIVLSCDSNRRKGAIVVSQQGVDVVRDIISFTGGVEKTKKLYLLETITRGLKQARSVVNHEDLLLIEVSNSHLAEWLNNQEEYKGYEKELGELYRVLDTLDCRYLFSYSKCKKAVKLLSTEVDKNESTEGALELLNSL